MWGNGNINEIKLSDKKSKLISNMKIVSYQINLISSLIKRGLKAFSCRISIICLFWSLIHHFLILVMFLRVPLSWFQHLSQTNHICAVLTTNIQTVMLSCQNLDKLFFLVTAVLQQKITKMWETFLTHCLFLSPGGRYIKRTRREKWKDGQHQNYSPWKRCCW